jgi:hypothetical protein
MAIWTVARWCFVHRRFADFLSEGEPLSGKTSKFALFLLVAVAVKRLDQRGGNLALVMAAFLGVHLFGIITASVI